ncbi:MAG: glycosyltransferase family 92 protein [Bacilli bacterium]
MAYDFILGKRPEDLNKPDIIRKNFFICAMIKDEHIYIREWALYHKKLGFNKIFLYDDNSSHSYEKELGDLILEGFIEIQAWHGNEWSRQSRAYNQFVWSRTWGDEDYCAFIDIDEFIYFDKAKNIEEFMEYYHEFAGVGLSWKMYNANGRIKAPTNLSTFEAYTQEFEYFEPRIKVIGRLKDILSFPTVHHFKPLRGRLVMTNNQTIHGMNAKYCDYTNGHIKHYITKSWEDWIRRLKRGNITRGLRTVDLFFRFNPDLNIYREELTKNLNYLDFPTIGKETRKWDGDL